MISDGVIPRSNSQPAVIVFSSWNSEPSLAPFRLVDDLSSPSKRIFPGGGNSTTLVVPSLYRRLVHSLSPSTNLQSIGWALSGMSSFETSLTNLNRPQSPLMLNFPITFDSSS